MRIAIYPGTFDPIHNGHIHIIKRAVRICDTLIVAVANNPHKETCIDIETRLSLARSSMRELGHSQVEVNAFDGLLSAFALKKKASYIIRGMRNFSDFEYEYQLCSANYNANPKIETVFLIPTESGFISSKLIKEIIQLKGDARNFAPQEIVSTLQNLATKKKLL